MGANLAALATIGVAFVIRPLGAIIFDHLGDRIGRRSVLIVTITMMGVATGLIGVLPTYEQAGWFGAILLVLLRILQGVSLGGEWGGAVLIATEHESRAKRAFAAAMPQFGSPIGSILSAVAFLWLTLALTSEEITEWAWRVPFLTAIPLFGAWATRIGSGLVVAIGALGTLLVSFPIYYFLQDASFAFLVGMMIIGGILPTMSWAALGGIFTELFDERYRYSTLGFACALADVVAGFVPALTGALGAATDNAWWHPAIVLAGMSLITFVASLVAIRIRVDRDDPPESAVEGAAAGAPVA